MTTIPTKAANPGKSGNRVIAKFLLLGIAFTAVPGGAFAGAAVDCEGSARAYKAQGIPCRCEGGRIVCSSQSGGASSSASSKKGLSRGNQMKLQMLQGAMDDFANSFIRWINAPPKGPTPEQIAAERERQERDWEETKARWRAKYQQQVDEMSDQYEQMERQKASSIKKHLLTGMKGLEAGPSALGQARCSAFWSKKAQESTDNAAAKRFADFAENPTADSMAECEKGLAGAPVPTPGQEFRSDLQEMMIEQINLRLPKIEEATIRQREANDLFAEKKRKVEELKGGPATAALPGEKQAADDLLAEAMKELEAATALKNEADAGLAKLQMEVGALNELAGVTKSPRE